MKNLFTLIRNLVTVLIKVAFHSGNSNRYCKSSQDYLALIERQVTTRGTLEMFRMVKAIRLHYQRILAGEPLLNSVSPSVGVNKKGVPKLASFLFPLTQGSIDDKRFLTTQLYLTRVFPGWGKVNYDSIVQPVTKTIPSILYDDIIKVQEILNLPQIDTSWTKPHLTTKAGPNGPALDTALGDLTLLPTWQVRDQINQGGIEFQTYIRECQSMVRYLTGSQTLNKRRNWLLRRLSLVYDPEGKIRVIAILDYWSQTVLKVLHEEILKILRTFLADTTFNQTGRLTDLEPRPQYYSYDLTAATDRFPIVVQELILTKLQGRGKSESWSRILVRQPYANPEGNRLYYKAGQPMGAYSSWPVFAQSHHIIVLVAAMRSGINPLNYSNYMLLGDDIVLGDKEVASNYLNIMEELGVSIDLNKSQVSSDTLEFAKRQVHNNCDISAAPIKSLYEGRNNLSAVLSFIRDLEVRWNVTTIASRPVIRMFLRYLVPLKDLSLSVDRIYETWMIPSKSDNEEVRNEKALICFKHQCFNYLGCSVSLERIWLCLNQFIPMIRMASIQSVIISNFRAQHKYSIKLSAKYQEIGGNRNCGTGNLPTHLMSWVPSQRASADQAKDLQSELDRMDQFIAEGCEENYFDTNPILGFDPSKISSRPRSQVISPIQSSLPKGVKLLVRKYLRDRETQLASKEGD